MATLYTGKARVRRARFPLTGELAWCASKPGRHYLVGDGLHFYDWHDAIAYATRPENVDVALVPDREASYAR